MITGIAWLALTIGVAGLVRGFTGFGTALIFVPVANRFLPPQDVIVLITLLGAVSTAALVPRAWVRGDRAEVGLLILAALPTVPFGLWVMTQLPQDTTRWIIAAIATITLAAIVSGRRYRGGLGTPGVLGVGAAAGLVGGMTGLTGPVVIMVYLASQRGADSVRSNTILFLAGLDGVIFANLLLGGLANLSLIWTAAVLSLPYLATTLVGQALFDPARERLYRGAAYAVIGLAVVTGLPIWE